MFKSFMYEALQEAKKAFATQEVPVGCIIVQNNSIIARSFNTMQASTNAINHAEILAINMACNILGSKYLKNCDMYVSLEPCNMCAKAISLVKIKRLYIAAIDKKNGAIYHNSKLFYTKQGINHIPEFYNGFLEKEASNLLREFFIIKRMQNNGA